MGVAVCLGLPFESSLAALQSFTGLAHRCEVVQTEDGVTWVNDLSHEWARQAQYVASATAPSLIAGGQAKQEDYDVGQNACWDSVKESFCTVGCGAPVNN